MLHTNLNLITRKAGEASNKAMVFQYSKISGKKSIFRLFPFSPQGHLDTSCLRSSAFMILLRWFPTCHAAAPLTPRTLVINKKTSDVHVTMRHIRVTTVAMEKQEVLHAIVVSNRRFGTTYWVPSSVRNYECMLRKSQTAQTSFTPRRKHEPRKVLYALNLGL